MLMSLRFAITVPSTLLCTSARVKVHQGESINERVTGYTAIDMRPRVRVARPAPSVRGRRPRLTPVTTAPPAPPNYPLS